VIWRDGRLAPIPSGKDFQSRSSELWGPVEVESFRSIVSEGHVQAQSDTGFNDLVFGLKGHRQA
jgi:hypothetical protein